MVALPWEPAPLPFMVVLKEVDVLSSIYYGQHGGVREFAQAADVLARHPCLADAIVTHRFGLDEAAEAFRVAADRAAGSIKVLIRP
jgi:threonine dehydrogenase-like Zn-dependent dehydrogenase